MNVCGVCVCVRVYLCVSACVGWSVGRLGQRVFAQPHRDSDSSMLLGGSAHHFTGLNIYTTKAKQERSFSARHTHLEHYDAECSVGEQGHHDIELGPPLKATSEEESV